MILVVGATGVVGGMITRRLLEEDKEVRVLVRRDSPSSQLVLQGLATSAESLIDAGAQPAHGDLRDRASLDAAVEGVETVISTANSAMRGGADNPQKTTRTARSPGISREGLQRTNLRPLGYEPNELPDYSAPRRCGTTLVIRRRA